MIQFLEKNGYDVSYVSQVDVAQPGAASMIEQHKVLMNTGHSEYWDARRMSPTSRRPVMPGSTSRSSPGTPRGGRRAGRTASSTTSPTGRMITYKESLDSTPERPRGSADLDRERGGISGSARPATASPENALTGQLWTVNCCSYADTVPSAYSKLQLWRNTAVASLASGQTYTMPDETLGYEWDSDVDNGFRPRRRDRHVDDVRERRPADTADRHRGDRASERHATA